MPVYVYPDLLERISGGLRARMTGKSCFNFRAIDPAQLEELAALTKKAYERYRDDGLLGQPGAMALGRGATRATHNPGAPGNRP